MNCNGERGNEATAFFVLILYARFSVSIDKRFLISVLCSDFAPCGGQPIGICFSFYFLFFVFFCFPLFFLAAKGGNCRKGIRKESSCDESWLHKITSCCLLSVMFSVSCCCRSCRCYCCALLSVGGSVCLLYVQKRFNAKALTHKRTHTHNWFRSNDVSCGEWNTSKLVIKSNVITKHIFLNFMDFNLRTSDDGIRYLADGWNEIRFFLLGKVPLVWASIFVQTLFGCKVSWELKVIC